VEKRAFLENKKKEHANRIQVFARNAREHQSEYDGRRV
jgi:hypothetical protein